MPFDRLYMISYVVFHCNYVSILHGFRDISAYFPKFKDVTLPWTRPFKRQFVIPSLPSGLNKKKMPISELNMYKSENAKQYSHFHDGTGSRYVSDERKWRNCVGDCAVERRLCACAGRWAVIWSMCRCIQKLWGIRRACAVIQRIDDQETRDQRPTKSRHFWTTWRQTTYISVNWYSILISQAVNTLSLINRYLWRRTC